MKSQKTTTNAPPPEVAGDPVAASTWAATVAALEQSRLWSDADRAVVARYALMASVWETARRDVVEGGALLKTKTGYESIRPCAVLVVKLAASLLALESALGLGPRSRSRLKVAPKPDEDDPDRRLLERLKVRV